MTTRGAIWQLKQRLIQSLDAIDDFERAVSNERKMSATLRGERKSFLTADEVRTLTRESGLESDGRHP